MEIVDEPGFVKIMTSCLKATLDDKARSYFFPNPLLVAKNRFCRKRKKPPPLQEATKYFTPNLSILYFLKMMDGGM
jgi:hypothetical protein